MVSKPSGHDEGVDLRLDLARELLEHQMLVLHLGRELRGLEQALAVPDERRNLLGGGRQRRDVDGQPLVEEREIRRAEHHDPWSARPAGCARNGTRGEPRSGRCSRSRDHRPAMKWASSSSLSYSVVAVARVGQTDRDIAVGDLPDRNSFVRDVGEEGAGGAERAAVVGLTGAAGVPETTSSSAC